MLLFFVQKYLFQVWSLLRYVIHKHQSIKFVSSVASVDVTNDVTIAVIMTSLHTYTKNFDVFVYLCDYILRLNATIESGF